MIYIINDNNDPYFNHAAEEYVMKNFKDEAFILWINKPAILIGKNQNTISEINMDYVLDNNIEVVRRLSGGGTVYNDLGNMNYTFITYKNPNENKLENGFEKFALPVIKALQSLEVNAEFSGRNDVTIHGKKFSGTAQYSTKDKLLHHGTIMYDCDMSKLSKALKPKPLKFKDKSVKSVSSRVTNIAEHMKIQMTVEEFREYLKDFIIKYNNIEKIYTFTEKDLEEIERIADARFRSWDWNYGKSPLYHFENSVKYKSGIVEYHLNVENGIIEDVGINGDFFGTKDVEEIADSLKGVRHDKKLILESLAEINIGEFIAGLSNEEFADGLLDIERTSELIES